MAKKEEQKKVTKLDEKVEGLRIFINTKYEEDSVNVKKTIDKEWLVEVVKEYLNPDIKINYSELDFYQALDIFINQEGQRTKTASKHWSYSTIQKFKTLKNHLLSFDKDLTFEDLDVDRISDFVTYEQEIL